MLKMDLNVIATVPNVYIQSLKKITERKKNITLHIFALLNANTAISRHCTIWQKMCFLK